MSETRTAFRRFIKAAEHGSEHILIQSTVFHTLIPLSISGGVAFFFGYLLYSSVEGTHFSWRVDDIDHYPIFYQYYLRHGFLWLDCIF